MADRYKSIFVRTGRYDAERVHNATLRMARLAGAVRPLGWAAGRMWNAPADPAVVFGLRFRNRVGLAAGFDKSGTGYRGLSRLGFGHIEIGTVTPKAQEGNPTPRVFRLDEYGAIINRMGFPNRGAYFVSEQLKKRRPRDLVIGVNIGMQASTPIEDAPRDYLHLLDTFAPLADYLTINVSSPNTPELRTLQAGGPLGELLRAMVARRRSIGSAIPLLVKLSPDLDDSSLDTALKAMLDSRVDGVIATNTTLARPPELTESDDEEGGLSGAPLFSTTLNIVREIRTRIGDEIPIVAAGGVSDAASFTEMRDAGASLVQLYTGLVFKGPRLVRDMMEGLEPGVAHSA